MSEGPIIRRARTPDEMIRLGAGAAERAAPGQVIALVGGLGAGKTHWTKGLVKALGCEGEVTSPTFGLVHEYRGGRIDVLHLDFYRLTDEEELLALGWDEILESGALVIAEWADLFPAVFPAEAQWFEFSVEPDGERVIREWGAAGGFRED